MTNQTRIVIEPGYALVRVFAEPVERDIPLYLRRDQYKYSFGAALNSFGEVEIQGVTMQGGDVRVNTKTMLGYLREISEEFARMGYPVVIWRHSKGIVKRDVRNPRAQSDDEIVNILMS